MSQRGPFWEARLGYPTSRTSASRPGLAAPWGPWGPGLQASVQPLRKSGTGREGNSCSTCPGTGRKLSPHQAGGWGAGSEEQLGWSPECWLTSWGANSSTVQLSAGLRDHGPGHLGVGEESACGKETCHFQVAIPMASKTTVPGQACSEWPVSPLRTGTSSQQRTAGGTIGPPIPSSQALGLFPSVGETVGSECVLVTGQGKPGPTQLRWVSPGAQQLLCRPGARDLEHGIF
jgi:hypothetical protein